METLHFISNGEDPYPSNYNPICKEDELPLNERGVALKFILFSPS